MVDSPTKISFRQYRELLVRYLAPQRRLVLLLAVLLFTNLGLQLVNPQILRRFIDSIGAGTALGGLIALALVFVGVALVQQVVSVFDSYMASKVAWTATNVLRTDLARHALSLDMSYHNAHTPGEMIERVDNDSETMGHFISTFAVDLLGNLLLLIGVLGLLFWEDWRAGTAVGGSWLFPSWYWLGCAISVLDTGGLTEKPSRTRSAFWRSVSGAPRTSGAAARSPM